MKQSHSGALRVLLYFEWQLGITLSSALATPCWYVGRQPCAKSEHPGMGGNHRWSIQAVRQLQLSLCFFQLRIFCVLFFPSFSSLHSTLLIKILITMTARGRKKKNHSSMLEKVISRCFSCQRNKWKLDKEPSCLRRTNEFCFCILPKNIWNFSKDNTTLFSILIILNTWKLSNMLYLPTGKAFLINNSLWYICLCQKWFVVLGVNWSTSKVWLGLGDMLFLKVFPFNLWFSYFH